MTDRGYVSVELLKAAEARVAELEARRWIQCTSVSNECLGGCANVKEHDRYRHSTLSNDLLEAQAMGEELSARVTAADVLIAALESAHALEVGALQTALATEIEKHLATTRERERVVAALYDVMGQQHVLKYAFGFVGRWGDDPSFSPETRKLEVERVEQAISEWHRRLVAAVKPEVAAAPAATEGVCGAWSKMLAAPCDLPPSHKGEHSSGGDVFSLVCGRPSEAKCPEHGVALPCGIVGCAHGSVITAVRR